MVDIAVRVPAGTGAVLRSITADKASVVVYSNAGLSTPVALPYTLPTSGSVTLYLGEVGRFRAVVTDTTGAKELTVSNGAANGATPLVFTVYGGADAATEAGPDLSGTYEPLGLVTAPVFASSLSAEVTGAATHPADMSADEAAHVGLEDNHNKEAVK